MLSTARAAADLCHGRPVRCAAADEDFAHASPPGYFHLRPLDSASRMARSKIFFFLPASRMAPAVSRGVLPTPSPQGVVERAMRA